jgi:hypothetical protein
VTGGIHLKVGTSLIALALALVFASSAAAASFDAHGSVEQVYATGLPAGAPTSLFDSSDQVVETRTANNLGGILFRNVTPGDGYRVRLDATGETSGPLTVLTTQSAPPSPDIYNQSVPSDGYGYTSMRDGTKLAYSVHPPTDVINAEGLDLPPEVTSQLSSLVAPGVKSPTLVEYSGYGYAKPDGPVSGIAALANIMGFTVVDVNMRGTGCSGGAFDFFEPLQNLDGYDVVETVAHQPWVSHGKVGMMGISYGGISQLFTARTPASPSTGPRSASTRPCRPARTAGSPTPGSRSRTAIRPVRRTRRSTPRRLTCSARSAPTTTTSPKWPTRSPRSPSSTRSTSRCSWPASGPTSRPAATAPRSPST